MVTPKISHAGRRLPSFGGDDDTSRLAMRSFMLDNVPGRSSPNVLSRSSSTLSCRVIICIVGVDENSG